MELFILGLQLSLAGVLAIAAVGKLRDLPGSRQAVSDFGVPTRFAKPLGTLLPFVEFLLAVGLLFGTTARLAAFGALLLFLAFIAGIAWNLRQGNHPDCHCFGEFHSAPASGWTIARNTVFASMAVVIVILGGQGIPGTYKDLSAAGQTGVWLALLAGVASTALWWLINRLSTQVRHVQAKLDDLQTSMTFERYDAAPLSDAVVGPTVDHPSGEPAPPFSLPTLSGAQLTLNDLRAGGKPVILLFTGPDCSYCEAMYPEVKEWTRRFHDQVAIALIGRGAIESNRAKLEEYGFEHVAIDEDTSVAAAYDAIPTPSAILILANGTLAADPPARGRTEIQKLVGRALQLNRRSIATPAIAAEATPAATRVSWPAVMFDLPTPDGGRVTLDGLLAREKPVFAVFWSPICGYCSELGPEAGEWVRRFGDDLTFAFLSSGGAEENQRVMNKFGLINMGLQYSTEVMQAMGGVGTPSAVLIQPDGFILDEPANGSYGVRRLLGQALNPRIREDIPPAPRPLTAVDDATPNDLDETATKTRAIQALLLKSATQDAPATGTPGSRLPWPNLDGSYTGLDDYRGDDLVLVFWGVDCAFSQRMLLDLKEWELSAGSTLDRVLIVSSGDVEANRAQGLRSTIVIDDAFAAGTEFGATGTPAAVRLDKNGHVSSGLVKGADAVIDLLYEFSKSRTATLRN